MNYIRLTLIILMGGYSFLLMSCGSNAENHAEHHNRPDAESSQEGEEQADPAQDSDSNTDSDVDSDPDTDSQTDPETEPEPESPWISEEGLNAMKVGQGYRLELESNATTGYQWALQPGMDEAVLTLESSQYVNPDRADGMTGVGGTEVFIFRAQGLGSTNVVLRYAQPWMPDDYASEFSFEVTVVE